MIGQFVEGYQIKCIYLFQDEFDFTAAVKRRNKKEELPPGWEKHQVQ